MAALRGAAAAAAAAAAEVTSTPAATVIPVTDAGITKDDLRTAFNHATEGGLHAAICSVSQPPFHSYSLEVCRWTGDLLHVTGLALCLAVVLRETGTEGVSMKTHLIFLVVYTSRFINIFFCPQNIDIIIYKVLIWQATVLIITLLAIRRAWEDRRDTFQTVALLIPTFATALFFGRFHSDDRARLAEIVWIFSMYLEAVAMLPQYIYCYRDKDNRSRLAFWYVQAMGAYRVVLGVTWAYHYLFNTGYLEFSSLISGVLGILFFADYTFFRYAKRSPLSQLCITVDEGIREAEEVARGAVLGDQTQPWEALKRASALAAVQAEEEERKARVGTSSSHALGRSGDVELTIRGSPVKQAATPAVMNVKGRIR